MSDIELTSLTFAPKVKWSMTIGDLTINHTHTEYSAWRAFWLRFMGWEVEKGDI